MLEACRHQHYTQAGEQWNCEQCSLCSFHVMTEVDEPQCMVTCAYHNSCTEAINMHCQYKAYKVDSCLDVSNGIIVNVCTRTSAAHLHVAHSSIHASTLHTTRTIHASTLHSHPTLLSKAP